MAEKEKKTNAAPRKKPEPRPAYIGLRVKGHPEIKKEDIEVVFTTRKVNTILEAVTGGENVIVTQIKID